MNAFISFSKRFAKIWRSFLKPFRETYEALHGVGSWEDYLDTLREYASESWSELLFLRADLSSK